MNLHASITIQASPELVAELYSDVERWPDVYPTIRAVTVVRKRDDTTIVSVAHRDEGPVRNVLTVIDPYRTCLYEEKRLYTATFDATFRRVAEGTSVDLVATIRVRGVLRLFSPLARPHARRAIHEGQLYPLKRAAERMAAGQGVEDDCDHASHTWCRVGVVIETDGVRTKRPGSRAAAPRRSPGGR